MNPSTTSRTTHGYLLLEATLALAIFSMAALALVSTLQETGLAVGEIRDEQAALDHLQSVLDEYSKMPNMTEGIQELPEDSFGVRYEVEISLERDIFNKDQVELPNIYRIIARAYIPGLSEPLETETLRYALLYQTR